MNVNCGTWNRVSRSCSKAPKLALDAHRPHAAAAIGYHFAVGRQADCLVGRGPSCSPKKPIASRKPRDFACSTGHITGSFGRKRLDSLVFLVMLKDRKFTLPACFHGPWGYGKFVTIWSDRR
jgi:hypothetical protein